MRLQKRSISKVSLLDLLRRRRTTLTKYLEETGIVTYELLKTRCASSGLLPPSEEQFLKARGNPVVASLSSPTEGVVVVETPVSVRTTQETGPTKLIPFETPQVDQLTEDVESQDTQTEVESEDADLEASEAVDESLPQGDEDSSQVDSGSVQTSRKKKKRRR